jgi:superfamily II DNA or RNA helicase
MQEQTVVKTRNTKLYPYQEADINKLIAQLDQSDTTQRILYQLPTGGGKTVIFSELARRFIEKSNLKVMILTHRVELCSQTSRTLKGLGIGNKLINSGVKQILGRDGQVCYVAMVETLKNRIKDGVFNTQNIGLVIIDEAHHNSFHKLLGKFVNASIIGVTATPFSSDVNLPMRRFYDHLIVGESVDALITQGFLAKPTTWKYDVELNTLKTGIHGDYTVSTSDELYSSNSMLDLLKDAYQDHAQNKKTLIFNNGIVTSKNVCYMFDQLGFPVRHLDNSTPPAERAEILLWFKKTKGAILTSVSILTTGFDEPSVQAVILNRATTSLTLYHQMIGRGSRRLANKKTFTIIDLGNNSDRFGNWNDPIDWMQVFNNPEEFHEKMSTQTVHQAHGIPSELRAKFPNTLELSFDIQAAHQAAVEQHLKPKIVIRDSIRQHAMMCLDNSDSIMEALNLTAHLDAEINWRIKQYGKCLGNVTRNYTDWLKEDYVSKLKTLIQKLASRRELHKTAV